MKGRIGPYRVSERLGTGGMGEVFKAYDDRLERWVAIKRIRPGKEDTEENRERFQREARATAQLNHSAIVHVYDIFQDGESDCIVMEYIEGRSLQSVAAESTLDPLQAAALGQEIAEGLAAAHTKGILHRDLKTENIIITPDGHAKILDFGLAKPLVSDELDPSITGKGQLVGTSRSMSPEYVGGEEVDHRSDLFALGVLLYEVTTGHSPFKAQNTLATLKQVIVHQQPPTHEVNPEVPQDLSDLIDRLLEKSPEDRPQSSKEVAIELGRISGQLSSGTIPRRPTSEINTLSDIGDWSFSTTVVDPRMRRYWIGFLAVIVAALTIAYFIGGWKSSPSTTPSENPPKSLLIVATFENNTNEKVLDNSLDFAFRTGLDQARPIEILPPQRVMEALVRMKRDPDTKVDREVGIEICRRENAHFLVRGSIHKVGDRYTLGAEIVDPQDGTNAFPARSENVPSQNEILEAFEGLVTDIVADLLDADPPQDMLMLREVTTSSLEALQAYSLGEARLDERRSDEAVRYFQQAIELDAEFGMAMAKLGTAFMNTGKRAEAVRQLEMALQFSERLTEYEKLYVEGTLARGQATPEGMASTWSLMSDLYPNRATGHHNLGMVNLHYLNEFDKAADAFEAALRIQKLDGLAIRTISLSLGYAYLLQGHYDASIELFSEAPVQDWSIVTGLATAKSAKGLRQEAESLLRSAVSEGTRGNLRYQLAVYAADRGQFEEALKLAQDYLNQVIREEDVPRAHFSMTASLSRIEGRDQDLVGSLEDAVALATDQNQVSIRRFPNESRIPYLAALGKIAVRNGSVDQARQILEVLMPLARTTRFSLWKNYADMAEGEYMAETGEVRPAIERLERAVARLEFFTGRESLAWLYKRNGDFEKARVEYEWILANRGRAFAECYLNCKDGMTGVIAWNLAHLHLGDIYKEIGQTEDAIASYEKFINMWEAGDQHESVRYARQQIKEIR